MHSGHPRVQIGDEEPYLGRATTPACRWRDGIHAPLQSATRCSRGSPHLGWQGTFSFHLVIGEAGCCRGGGTGVPGAPSVRTAARGGSEAEGEGEERKGFVSLEALMEPASLADPMVPLPLVPPGIDCRGSRRPPPRGAAAMMRWRHLALAWLPCASGIRHTWKSSTDTWSAPMACSGVTCIHP